MPSLIDTLNSFNLYLQDDDAKANFISLFKLYHADRNQFNRDFYTITLNEHRDLDVQIMHLLKTLSIPETQWGRYRNQKITVYALLNELKQQPELNEESTRKLNALINRLDKQANTRWLNIFILALGFSAFLITPFYALGLTAMEQLLTVASFISGSGLIFAVGVGFKTLYEYHADEPTSYFQVFRDNFLALSKIVLTIAAWALMLTAAVTTPVVSVLFVLADAVIIVKELISLAYIYLKNAPLDTYTGTISEQQTQARELSDFEMRRHSVWVRLAAAVMMTTIVAAWCFVPGAPIVVAAIALTAMAVVILTERYAIKENEIRMQRVLKERFVEAESTEQLGQSVELVDEMNTACSQLDERLRACPHNELALDLDVDFVVDIIPRNNNQSIRASVSQLGMFGVGRVENSSSEGLRPATRSRDPEILLNTQHDCTETDRSGSRERVAGRRDLNCQHVLINETREKKNKPDDEDKKPSWNS